MSVIFKSLKKLKGRSPSKRNIGYNSGKKQRFYSFKKLSARRRIGTILLILFSTAGISVLSLQYIKDYIHDNNIRVKLLGNSKGEKKREAPPKAFEAPIAEEIAELPPSVSDIKNDIPHKDIATPPPPSPGTIPEFEETNVNNVQYIPPAPPKEERIVINNIPQGREKKEVEGIKIDIEKRDKENIINMADISPPSKKSAEIISKIEVAKRPKIYTKNNKNVPPSLKSSAQTKKKGSLQKRRVITKQTKSEKNMTIASIVTKINRAIGSGNSSETKILIDRLSLLKGENSDYVLKLRAYWHLSEGNNSSAAYFLNRMLTKNRDDFDAGINMAILELKTDRIDKGKKRLRKLREIYPDNELISDLLKKTDR